MEVRSERELLSAYKDGELEGAEKARIERALREDPELRMRLEDLDALSGMMRATFEAEADAVDFSGLADRVLAEVPRRRAPFFKRLRVATLELLEFRRWQVVATTAAVAALLAVGPLMLTSGGDGELMLAGGPDLARVVSLNPADDTDAMLITTASGATVIYVQERE